MVICDYCGKEIKNIPFHCRRCGRDFCSEHRLPEDHECVGLKKENIFKKIYKKPKRHYRRKHYKRRRRSLRYYWYHYKSYIYLFIIILLIILAYNYREEILDKIKPYYDKYVGEKITEEPEVEIRIVNELVNSHFSCYDLDVNKRPSTCMGICKKLAGTYILDRCTGDDEVYCKCKFEIKEYIIEEVEEVPEEKKGFLDELIGIIEVEPISDKTKKIEKLIWEYTNKERTDHGIKELKWDEKLSNIAREHSLDMVENDFFAHVNLNGEDPTARAERHDYDIYKGIGGGAFMVGIAENIGTMGSGNIIGIGYVSPDADSIARAQVKSWMDSTGHRMNILDSQYDRLGVGVAYGRDYISTQNFQ